MIVCDPRRTWVAEHADIHIQHKPGTDNMLINAMMRHILDQGLHDAEFIASRCENFDAFRANLDGCSVEEAAEVCDVDAELIRQAAEMYAQGEPSAIFYTLGITEHTCGTENVMNLANLAMLCRPDRQALQRRQPAARAEQRAGWLRHGRHARCPSPATRRSSTRTVRLKFSRGLAGGDAHQQGWPHPRLHRGRGRRLSARVLRVRRGSSDLGAQPGQGHRQPREAGVPGGARRSS